MDQGLFTLSNFILNLLLARWLTPQDYGLFSVIFTLFLLLGTFHTALVSEPLLIFVSGKSNNKFRYYLKNALYIHLLFSVLCGLLLFLLLGNKSTMSLTLIICMPIILYQWLMRRACYVNLDPKLASFGGAIYMFTMFVGVILLHKIMKLSGSMSIGLMGISSLISGVFIQFRLFSKYKYSDVIENRDRFRDILKKHWSYGRWALLTGLLTWIPGNIYFFLLPKFVGLQGVAEFKAVLNFTNPMTQINAALGSLILPNLVRFRETTQFNVIINNAIKIYLISSLGYWILLVLGGKTIASIVYNNSYSLDLALFIIAGLLPLVAALNSVYSSALKALEKPKLIFLAYLVSTLVTFSVGLVTISFWQVHGAVLGNLLSLIFTTIVLIYYLKKEASIARGEN